MVQDAIDHLTAKIRLLEKKIETTRNNIGEKVAENFGFASFARTAYAQIVARCAGILCFAKLTDDPFVPEFLKSEDLIEDPISLSLLLRTTSSGRCVVSQG